MKLLLTIITFVAYLPLTAQMQTVAQQTKMNAFVSSLMSKMTIAEKIG